MKSITLILMILCGGLYLSYGENLNCDFYDLYDDYYRSMFTCDVLSFDNSYDNVTIDGFTNIGYTPYNNETSVDSIKFSYTSMTYIPKNLGFAKGFCFLSIRLSKLVEIKSENFFGMQNLKFLRLNDNKLTSVPSNVFTALTKLREISLSSNKIQEIPNQLFSSNVNLERIYLDYNEIKDVGSSLFKGLTQLRTISLSHNQIEELQNDLFSDNVNLKDINLVKNKIKFIGSTLFDGLINLYEVYLKKNICINKEYEGKSEIIEMRKDIQTKCFNPNEVSSTTTTTTPTPTIEFIPTLSNVLDETMADSNEKLKNGTTIE